MAELVVASVWRGALCVSGVTRRPELGLAHATVEEHGAAQWEGVGAGLPVAGEMAGPGWGLGRGATVEQTGSGEVLEVDLTHPGWGF